MPRHRGWRWEILFNGIRKSIEAARITRGEQLGEGRGRFEFSFAATDPTFAGHFPARPLVPGIFQIEMVREAAEWMLGDQLVIKTVGRAKFQRPILPGEIIQLEISLLDSAGVIQVRGAFSVVGEPAGDVMLTLGADMAKAGV